MINLGFVCGSCGNTTMNITQRPDAPELYSLQCLDCGYHATIAPFERYEQAIAALRKENEAAVKDLASLRGQSCPCHICEFVDMIRCCHDAQCSEKNLCFKWRGLPSAPTPPRTNFDALTESPEALAAVLYELGFGYCQEKRECQEMGIDLLQANCKQCLMDWLNGAAAENAEA